MNYIYIIIVGYNDLDHLIPFIYQAADQPASRHTIWLTGQARCNTKVRNLTKLAQVKGIKVIEGFSNPLIKLLALFLLQIEEKIQFYYFNRTVTKLKSLLLSLDSHFLPDCLQPRTANICISAHTEIPEVFIKEAKRNSENKFFLLPHGFPICKNSMQVITQLQKIQVSPPEDSIFDSRIVTDAFLKNKSTRIGSLRFSRYWLNLKKEFDAPMAWNKTCKLKIVLIDPKDQVNTFRDEVWRTCQMILQMMDCSIAVANRGNKPPKSIKHLLDSPNFLWMPAEIATSSAIDWADIVIHNGTTLHAECIEKNKVTILPRYFACNKTYCEIYGSALVAETRDDLYNFIESARTDFNQFKQDFFEKTKKGTEKFSSDFYDTDVNPFEQYIKHIKKVIYDEEEH